MPWAAAAGEGQAAAKAKTQTGADNDREGGDEKVFVILLARSVPVCSRNATCCNLMAVTMNYPVAQGENSARARALEDALRTERNRADRGIHVCT